VTAKKVTFGARPKAVASVIDPDAADAFVAGGAEQPNGPKPTKSDADAPSEKLKFKRLTIDIEASLHKRLKARTAEEDTTIADVARQLLTDWVYR
jgi:hypothetical protein